MRRIFKYRFAIAFSLLAAANTWGLFAISQQSDQNNTARQALCEIKMDYQKQIRRSGILLGWIPSVDPDVANLDPGDRLFGIPKALIIEGLLEDLDTYESLREIHCE